MSLTIPYTQPLTLAIIMGQIFPLFLAMMCGGIIGAERQMRRKPSGLRTNMLVCLGTTVYVILGSDMSGVPGADPTRILGQIIVGIGFLGAGSIMTRSGSVVGMTTAATIWMNAAVGAAIGLGHYFYAILSTILCVFILFGLPMIDLRPKRAEVEAESQPLRSRQKVRRSEASSRH